MTPTYVRIRPPGIQFAFLTLSLVLAGCAPARVAQDAGSTHPLAHENLHAVLWTQTSVEFAAVTKQVFRMATIHLDEALSDTTWTASLEQRSISGYGMLPPAVVLDIDETVLDNSIYQARLVLEDAEFDLPSWQHWVREEAATEIPGALHFTKEAERRGIAVLYLSNRRAETEESTRANLLALGFPVAEEYDTVVSRGERPDWDTSDKETRRRYIAERFRILMLLGDNLGDFISDVDQPPAARREMTQPFDDYWGTRWFMLPNPQYGSWESVLFDGDYSLGRGDRLRFKRSLLDDGS